MWPLKVFKTPDNSSLLPHVIAHHEPAGYPWRKAAMGWSHTQWEGPVTFWTSVYLGLFRVLDLLIYFLKYISL